MIVSVLITHSHDSVVDWELQLPASDQHHEMVFTLEKIIVQNLKYCFY